MSEGWFIPLDILSIICASFVIVFPTFLLLIIIFDKTCHTVPMILIANSCLAALILAIDRIWMSIFTLNNDMKQVSYEDMFCVLRGYLGYSLCALQNYSYLLQAIYRYTIVIYPTKYFWQKHLVQIALIILTWVFSLAFPLIYVFTGEIKYNMNNQICQLVLHRSASLISAACCIYIIPIIIMTLVYIKLVRYVQKINRRNISVNTLYRAKNELTMVRRTVILATILFSIDFPYALFVFMSLFTPPPIYHFRIAWIFVDISLLAVIITLFQFTEPLKISVRRLLNNAPNRILPTVT